MRRTLCAVLAAAMVGVTAGSVGADGTSSDGAPARCPPGASAAKKAAPGTGVLDEYVLRSTAAKTAPERYAVGLWCHEQGLLPESTAQFRETIRLDPEHAAARKELGESLVDGRWVPSEEALRARGLVRWEGRWVLPEEKAILAAPAEERARLGREEDRARKLIETLAADVPSTDGGEGPRARMAREALAGIDDRSLVKPLAFALRAKSPAVRLHAAKELGRIGDRRSFRALVARSLRDPAPEVRAACVDAALAFGDAEILAPYVRTFLNSGSADVRAAAAEAIGRTRDLRGVQYLVYAIEGHGGGSRAHIYAANQLTFIQDFDVEVAQTAFIADPIVGVLQEGAVLDVHVLSNEWYGTRVERHAIYGALRGLTGADLEESPAAWRKWMGENRERLTAKR